MTCSINIRLRVVALSVVVGSLALLAPLANAGYDRNRVADSVDTARTGVIRTPVIQAGYGRHRVADSVDAARASRPRARRRHVMTQQGYGRDRVADSVDQARRAR